MDFQKPTRRYYRAQNAILAYAKDQSDFALQNLADVTGIQEDSLSNALNVGSAKSYTLDAMQ